MNTLIILSGIYAAFWLIISARMIIAGSDTVLAFFYGRELYFFIADVQSGIIAISSFYLGILIGVRHVWRVWYDNHQPNKKLITVCILLLAPYLLWIAGYLRGTALFFG